MPAPAPVITVVLALLCGAAGGLAVESSAAVAACALAIGCVLAGLGLWRRRDGWFLAGVLCAFAGGGALLATRAWTDAWQPSLRQAFERAAGADGDAVVGVLTGVLRSDAAVGAESILVAVDARTFTATARASGRREDALPVRSTEDVRGGVQLSVGVGMAGEAVDAWRAGRTIRMPVRLRRPQVHRNPGSLDEARALARRGVILTGSVKSSALVEVLARGSAFDEAAAATRRFVRRAVARHIIRWSPLGGAIVAAILIGDRAGLSPDVQRSLQEAGTYHVIAISGGNIAIFAALTLTLFRWGGVIGRTAMVTAILLFLAYGAVVNGGASVDRAITVAVLAFTARALDLRVSAGHTLLLAGGLLVAADPLALVDPGFLLSYGATVGILVTAPLLTSSQPDLRRERPVASRGPKTPQSSPSSQWRLLLPSLLSLPLVAIRQAALGMLLSSAAAEAALVPVVAFFFGRITVAGLALNFAAIPLMAVAQLAGLVVVAVSAISTVVPAVAAASVVSVLADVAGWLAAQAAAGLVASATLVHWMPAVAWRVSRPAAWVIAGYYAVAALAWVSWRLRVSRVVTGSALAVWGALALWIAAEPWTLRLSGGDGRLHVTVLDVGQGDATLVRFPRGAAWLVDAGGAGESYDIGDRVVTPALRFLGVRHLSTYAISHGDLDHAGGSPTVIRSFAPFDVWEGVPVPRLPLLQQARAAADAVQARWTTVQSGDHFAVDDVEVRVVHPSPPDWERQDPRNDDSLVLELRWRDVSIVLPGDIGRDTEQLIAERFAPVRYRVLKVPHHGSATSSGEMLLEHLQPTLAIVSAGRGNAFGHPAPSVVSRYDRRGIGLYRTDQDGAVTIDTDGHALEVSTISGRTAYWPPR